MGARSRSTWSTWSTQARRRTLWLGVLLLTAGAALLAPPVWSPLGGRGHIAVLPLPARGAVLAEWLPDDTPVFVVRERNGAVRVLEALHPYGALDAAGVAWCPAAGRFLGVHTGSRFSRDGRWLGGPAPRGLAGFPAEVVGGAVRVGGRRPGPAREAAPDDGLDGGADQDCWDPGSGDLALTEVLLHGEPWGDAVAPSTLASSGATGTLDVRGIILEHPDGRVELCDELRGAERPRCRGRSVVRAPRGDTALPGVWYGLEGYARVALVQGRLVRVTLTAVTRFAGAHDPTAPARRTDLGDPSRPVVRGRTLTIPAVDIDFPGGSAEVSAGTWTIRLANHGGIAHSIRMAAPVSWLVHAPPGQFAGAEKVRLRPGTFTLYCALPGHRESGMELTLQVRQDAAS